VAMTVLEVRRETNASSEKRSAWTTALWLVLSFVVLTGAVAALGWLLAHTLAHTFVGADDRGVERTLAAHRTRSWNDVTHLTTWLAETPTITLLTLGVAVLARIVWKRWRDFLFVAIAVIGETKSFLVVTMLVHRARPAVPHLDPAPPTSSFPSGHTAASVAFYGALAILLSARVRHKLLSVLLWGLAVVIPLTVALSRMYRGMHFPTDVAAGLLLGATWLTLVAVLIGPWSRYERAGP
jgi:membrane-associated phospholipid phosphatase